MLTSYPHWMGYEIFKNQAQHTCMVLPLFSLPSPLSLPLDANDKQSFENKIQMLENVFRNSNGVFPFSALMFWISMCVSSSHSSKMKTNKTKQKKRKWRTNNRMNKIADDTKSFHFWRLKENCRIDLCFSFAFFHSSISFLLYSHCIIISGFLHMIAIPFSVISVTIIN